MNQHQPSSNIRTSVALCTYNGARFLREQLESITGQTQAVDEVVICDDGSTDGTIELIQAFAPASPVPIRLEQNPVRLGVTKNFEKAISLCQGGVIFLSDQDDRWQPPKVQRLLSAFQNPAVGLAFSNAQVVREDLSPAGYRLWQSVWFSSDEQQQVRDGAAAPVLLRHAVAAGSTLAFRAEYLPLVLPIPDLPHSHDIWITLLIGCIARLQPMDEDLIRYRLHGGNHVGLRRHNLLSQIRMARRQIETNAFEYAANLHAAMYERLTSPAASQWTVPYDVLARLQEKIEHSRARQRMPKGWPSRLKLIKDELRNGNYRKYSYGYKSVLQDLILR